MKRVILGLIQIVLLSKVAFAQLLPEASKSYIQEHAISIDVDSTYANGNWSPLIERIKDKKLILLGEFNHGSREVFLARNDLIRAIYEQLGIDLILFESGFGEVGALNMKCRELSDRELTSGFFGGWRTSEFDELMAFICESKIEFGGFDVQRTGLTFESYLGEQGISVTEIEDQYSTIGRQLAASKVLYDSVRQAANELIGQYRLMTKNSSDDFVIQAISNRITYLEYMLEFARFRDWNLRWMARDRAMAANVQWYLDHVGPGKRVVIIGHNFHIARFNEQEEVMGEFLIQNHWEAMYGVGFFAGKGTYSDNFGKPVTMAKADSVHLDIKHVVEAANSRVSFLDIPDAASVGNEWLFQDITVNDTFIDLSRSPKLNLSKCFDGLILIDRVSPAK